MRISKLIMVAGLLAVVTSAGAFAQSAQTSDEGSIILTGMVAGRVSISVTPEGEYNSLDLMANVSNLQVATVTERSNVSSGYTVRVSSSNFADGSPRFAGGAGNDTLAYSISYDGSPVDFSENSPIITDVNSRLESVAGVSKALRISYDGSSVNIVEGSYSDQLTFTIEAK